jgi:hypothetical protein
MGLNENPSATVTKASIGFFVVLFYFFGGT